MNALASHLISLTGISHDNVLMTLQKRVGAANGAKASADGPQVNCAGIKPLQKKAHAVHAGEDQPVIRRQPIDRVAERPVIEARDLGRGHLDDVRPELAELFA